MKRHEIIEAAQARIAEQNARADTEVEVQIDEAYADAWAEEFQISIKFFLKNFEIPMTDAGRNLGATLNWAGEDGRSFLTIVCDAAAQNPGKNPDGSKMEPGTLFLVHPHALLGGDIEDEDYAWQNPDLKIERLYTNGYYSSIVKRQAGKLSKKKARTKVGHIPFEGVAATIGGTDEITREVDADGKEVLSINPSYQRGVTVDGEDREGGKVDRPGAGPDGEGRATGSKSSGGGAPGGRSKKQDQKISDGKHKSLDEFGNRRAKRKKDEVADEDLKLADRAKRNADADGPELTAEKGYDSDRKDQTGQKGTGGGFKALGDDEKHAAKLARLEAKVARFGYQRPETTEERSTRLTTAADGRKIQRRADLMDRIVAGPPEHEFVYADTTQLDPSLPKDIAIRKVLARGGTVDTRFWHILRPEDDGRDEEYDRLLAMPADDYRLPDESDRDLIRRARDELGALAAIQIDPVDPNIFQDWEAFRFEVAMMAHEFGEAWEFWYLAPFVCGGITVHAGTPRGVTLHNEMGGFGACNKCRQFDDDRKAEIARNKAAKICTRPGCENPVGPVDPGRKGSRISTCPEHRQKPRKASR